MDVDAAEPGPLEHGRRQDEPVGADDEDVGPGGGELGLRFRRPQRWGLEDGNAGSHRPLLDGGAGQLHPPALGPVGGGGHRKDAVVGVEQGLERRHRCLGRAEEDGPERHSSAQRSRGG